MRKQEATIEIIQSEARNEEDATKKDNISEEVKEQSIWQIVCPKRDTIQEQRSGEVLQRMLMERVRKSGLIKE